MQGKPIDFCWCAACVLSDKESMVSKAQVKEGGFYVCLLQVRGFASSGESRVLLGKSTDCWSAWLFL